MYKNMTKYMSAVLSIWLLAIQSVHAQGNNTETLDPSLQYEVVYYPTQGQTSVEMPLFDVSKNHQQHHDVHLHTKSIPSIHHSAEQRLIACLNHAVDWRTQRLSVLNILVKPFLVARVQAQTHEPEAPVYFFS